MGGRMCWCAAGGWGGTMDGLVSPLADWFEMAPLSLSPWGVPLSCFWFPLLTNSKQKSISFSRGGKISTRVLAGESDSKTYLQEMADSLTPLPLFMSFFLLFAFILFICSPYCPMVVVDSGMMNDPGFSDWSGAGAPVGGLEPALRPGSLILKYTEMPSRAGLKSVWCRPGFSPWMDLCFQSLMKSLLFFFSVFSFSFFPPWKDSLTNYDSWVEGLSLFKLQRQTCESRGARNVINVSAVHLIFCLWCVKVPGFARAAKHISVMQRWRWMKWKWCSEKQFCICCKLSKVDKIYIKVKV